LGLERSYGGQLVGGGDPSAIHIDAGRVPGAVLAFHGFAGTPNEVRVIVDAATDLGLAAHAPRLPGHGSEARTLLSVGWNDWARAARDELVHASDLSKAKVVVAGLSLGALIATHLAATFPERVAGLVVLANAIRLSATVRLPLRFFEVVKPFENRFFVRKTGPDIRDPVARRAHTTYDVNPIAGAVEVLRAGRVVRAELANVRCPALIVHGALDRVCPPENASSFANELGSSDVEIALMSRSGHIVSVDCDRREVAARVASFLRRVAIGRPVVRS
jgi:carboxylesterase